MNINPEDLKGIFKNASPSFIRANTPTRLPAEPVQPKAAVPAEVFPEVKIQDPQPEQNKADTLGGTTQGKEEGVPRTLVCFTLYRCRPLDPDNAAGSVKNVLDGLRHAKIILDDGPTNIILQVDQKKVPRYENEATEISVYDI